jgi:hypothetical protein
MSGSMRPYRIKFGVSLVFEAEVVTQFLKIVKLIDYSRAKPICEK